MRNILLILVVFTLFSCGETRRIGFTSPFPAKAKQCSSIDKKLIGSYVFNDNQLVLISLQDTFRIGNEKTLKSEVFNRIEITSDSINTLIHGKFIVFRDSLSNNDYYQTINKLDSFILSYSPYYYKKHIDSTEKTTIIILDISSNLFNLSDTVIIRKWKGSYYYNVKHKDINIWMCFQIEYNKLRRRLSINTFTEEDYAVMNRLIKLYGDLDEKDYFPSMKTFRKFLKLNGFERKIELKRE